MNAVLDKNVQRKVKSLKVRCSDYMEGCEWVGELKDLHNHLDPAIGGCGTTCPFGEDDVCIATEVVLGSAGQEGGLAGEQTRGLTSVM